MSQTKALHGNSNEIHNDPDQGNGEWEIKKIHGHRIVQGKLVYHVEWTLRPGQEEDWSDSENWVEAHNVRAAELVEQYKKKLSPHRLSELNRAAAPEVKRRHEDDAGGSVVSDDEIDPPRSKKQRHQKKEVKMRQRSRKRLEILENETMKKEERPEKRRERCHQKSPVRREATSPDSSSSEDSPPPRRSNSSFTNNNINSISVDREKIRHQAKKIKILPSPTKNDRGMIDYRSDGISLSRSKVKALQNQMKTREKGIYRAKESLLEEDEHSNRTTPPSEDVGTSSARRRGEAFDDPAVPPQLPHLGDHRTPLNEHIDENYEDIDDDDEIEEDEDTAPPDNSETLVHLLPDSPFFDCYERFALECFEYKYNALENDLKPVYIMQFFEKPAEDGEEELKEWAMVVFENKPGAKPKHVCEAVLMEQMMDINMELVIDCEERLTRKEAMPLTVASDKFNSAQNKGTTR